MGLGSLAAKRFVIYGSRPDGHAKVVLEACEELGMKCVGMLDDFPENRDRNWRGLTVLGGREDLPRIARDFADALVFGFSDGAARVDRIPDIERAGLDLPVLISPGSQISPSARIGAGSQILWGVRLGPDAELGPAVLANAIAAVSHDTRLGAGVTLGPGVQICGRVSIGDAAMVGAGAVLIPDVAVGREATVGAGAVVVSDVEAGEVVVGAPARPLRARR
jgi:UDP-perosamine 4-acetyltransferase